MHRARRLQLQGQPRLQVADHPHRVPILSPLRGTDAIKATDMANRKWRQDISQYFANGIFYEAILAKYFAIFHNS